MSAAAWTVTRTSGFQRLKKALAAPLGIPGGALQAVAKPVQFRPVLTSFITPETSSVLDTQEKS